jgi:hypothetical protein
MREEDERARIDKAVESAEQKVRAEAEAKEEQTILNFHNIGVPIADISKATSKTVAEIEQIILKNKQ